MNVLNGTGSETYDTTTYFYIADENGKKGTFKTSITDTSAGTTSLTCGETYYVEVQSTNGAAGDSAEILTASEGKILDNGALLFTAKDAGNRLTLRMHQRGLPEVRAKDLVTDQFMYDDSDNGARKSFVAARQAGV